MLFHNSLKKNIRILGFLILAGLNSYGQDGNPIQFLSEVSQSSQTNPAFQNQTDKLVIGLPVLSGTSIEWDANFALDYIFAENFTYSFSNFYNSLDGSGKAFSTANIPLVYLSLKKNKSTFSFSVSEKFIVSSSFDKEVLDYLDRGTLEFYGKNEDYGPLSTNIQHYREISVGFSTEIFKGFNIGIRPKILFGKLYYDFQDINLEVRTISELEQLEVSPIGTFTMTGPVTVEYNTELNKIDITPSVTPGDYFFKLKNLGASIDLGFSYAYNSSGKFALSVSDLGFFGVKYNTHIFDFIAPIVYNQDDLYQSNDPEASDYLEPKEAIRALSTSISSTVYPSEPNKRIYNLLPIKVNAGLFHSLSKKTEAGISNQYTYYKNNSCNFLTGFIHTDLGERPNIAATLSLYNIENIMPGFGASYTNKNVQYYLSTNNILKLVQPSSAKNINLCFGVNLLFSTQPK